MDMVVVPVRKYPAEPSCAHANKHTCADMRTRKDARKWWVMIYTSSARKRGSVKLLKWLLHMAQCAAALAETVAPDMLTKPAEKKQPAPKSQARQEKRSRR